jgi:hypothetical protein
MAETALNILKGFTPTRKVGSNAATGGLNAYPVSNGYATAIGNGDPVKLSAGKIELATNAGAVLGTLQGVMYVDSNGAFQVSPNFVAATSSKAGVVVAQGLTQPIALVNDDPNQTFVMRTVTAASISAGMIGRSFKVSAIGSVVGGRSQCVIDVAASAGTSGGHMITVMGLFSEPGNAWGNAPTAVEVKLSNPGIIGEL